MLGVALLAFLSWLPQKIDALVVVSEAIADLIRGLAQLLEALLGIAAVILLALLLVAALVALLRRRRVAPLQSGQISQFVRPRNRVKSLFRCRIVSSLPSV